jgi:thiaminase
MTFQEKLMNEFNAFEDEVSKFPWHDAQAYSDFLAQTFYFVKESTKLLLLAAAYSPMNSKLQFRFNDHAREERGHEKLLRMDLDHLGLKVENLPEHPATSSFYQPQYYWIQHNDPRAFFGYVLFLEGAAVHFGPRVYEKVVAAHGKSAGHFLKAHGHEDVEHVEKAMKEISQMEPEVLAKIEHNFKQASAMYLRILQSCAASASSVKTLKKAA